MGDGGRLVESLHKVVKIFPEMLKMSLSKTRKEKEEEEEEKEEEEEEEGLTLPPSGPGVKVHLRWIAEIFASRHFDASVT
ncbi:hypothetical protein M0804_014437 [Polistes exclamans]|nr:hypothetical protein M0804_014439 [Polistes exclamans]KAI4475225.1 hypothetical protein M0804_014437 [Polistes exclamans]